MSHAFFSLPPPLQLVVTALTHPLNRWIGIHLRTHILKQKKKKKKKCKSYGVLPHMFSSFCTTIADDDKDDENEMGEEDGKNGDDDDGTHDMCVSADLMNCGSNNSLNIPCT